MGFCRIRGVCVVLFRPEGARSRSGGNAHRNNAGGTRENETSHYRTKLDGDGPCHRRDGVLFIGRLIGRCPIRWDFAAFAACVLFCSALKEQDPGAVGNAHQNNARMIPFLILAHNKNKRR